MVDPIQTAKTSPAFQSLLGPSKSFAELQDDVRAEKPSILRPELVLIETNKRLDDLKNRMLRQEERSLDKENEAAKKAIEESLAASRETNTSGSYYLDLVTSFFTSCYLVMRGSLGIAANIPGASAQVAAGMVGYANNLMSHHYGWNWITDILNIQTEEKRETLRRLLPMLATGCMYGLALYGVYQSGTGAQGIEAFINQFMTFLGTAVAIGQIPNTYLQGKAQMRSLTAQANFSLHQKNIESIYRTIEVLMDEFRRLSSTIKKAFKSTIQETSAAARGF